MSKCCVSQVLLPLIMSSTSSSYSSSGETSPEDVPRGGGTIRVYLPNKQRTVVSRDWLYTFLDFAAVFTFSKLKKNANSMVILQPMTINTCYKNTVGSGCHYSHRIW